MVFKAPGVDLNSSKLAEVQIMKLWVVLLRNKRLMGHFFLGMSYRGPTGLS